MFVFCIVVSALASGLVVASKGLLERINAKFKFNTNARIRLRRTANVPNPHLKRVHASGSAFLEAGPERRLAQVGNRILPYWNVVHVALHVSLASP